MRPRPAVGTGAHGCVHGDIARLRDGPTVDREGSTDGLTAARPPNGEGFRRTAPYSARSVSSVPTKTRSFRAPAGPALLSRRRPERYAGVFTRHGVDASRGS